MKVVRRALASGRAAFCISICTCSRSTLRCRRNEHMKSFLRGRAVMTRTGLSRTTIWRLVKAKKFPKPVPITDSGLAIGWVESEVDEWIQARIQQRDQQEARRAPVSIRRKAEAAR